jgi:hypothetical protein
VEVVRISLRVEIKLTSGCNCKMVRLFLGMVVAHRSALKRAGRCFRKKEIRCWILQNWGVETAMSIAQWYL